jgi:ectoine hydroxylase-related dioxygenase (phytanoyl-CoA dioxygenase family)
MTATAAPAPLTGEQVEFFEREGYLVVENLFESAVLDMVAAEVTAEINHRAMALVAQGKLSSLFDHLPFERQLIAISKEDDSIREAILAGRLAGPAFFNLIRYEPLLDVAAQLCESQELVASSVYRLRPKLPGHKQSPVPWHQDSGYFEPYCDDSLILTVWLPLVDATQENGCMWVIPRAHKGEVFTHRTDAMQYYLEIPPDYLPAGPEHHPICVPIKRGGALLLTNRTPHASFENNTDGIRWSMDLRYQSAKLPTNAPITRLPDEAVGSEALGIPIACYPPEADFLVRSPSRPHEVLTDAETFRKLRQTHKSQAMTNRWASNHVVS